MMAPHLLACHAFRAWCFRHSPAVYDGKGRLGPLRRLLAEIPFPYLEA